MRIGLIEKEPAHTKTAYWFMALGCCEEVEEISINIDMVDRYKFFPLTHKKIVRKPVRVIEDDTTLDFILYGWEYIRREGIPNTKVPCGAIFGGAKRWTFGGRNKAVIDKCDVIFKMACPEDLEVFLSNEGKPERFRSSKNLLDRSQIDKIRPLMFIGSWTVDYPDVEYNFSIPLSFYGSPTSLNRMKAVDILKRKYGKKFIGGFINRKLAKCDEFGNDVSDEDPIAKAYLIKTIRRKDYLLLMKKTIVNVCPSGLGNSSHRFVDILCMGGFCLTTTLQGLDYGFLAPSLGIHYIEYEEDCSDLVDKVEYYLSKPEEAKSMGSEARKFMKRTYLKPDRMAREYILKEFSSAKEN